MLLVIVFCYVFYLSRLIIIVSFHIHILLFRENEWMSLLSDLKMLGGETRVMVKNFIKRAAKK